MKLMNFKSYPLLIIVILLFNFQLIQSVEESEISKKSNFGTYKPNLYFNLNTPTKDSKLNFGLLWQSLNSISDFDKIRFYCEQTEDFDGYGYLKHDFDNFGYQRITDNLAKYQLNTYFVKKEELDKNRWLARVNGTSLNSDKNQIAVYFYISLETDGEVEIKKNEKGLIQLIGNKKNIGRFQIDIKNEGNIQGNVMGLTIDQENLWKVKEILTNQLIKTGKLKYEKILKENPNQHFDITTIDPKLLFKFNKLLTKKQNNLFLFQFIIDKQKEFNFDILFNQLNDNDDNTDKDLNSNQITNIINNYDKEFDNKFNAKFNLNEYKNNTDYVVFAKYSLSNLIGGVGYFYGNSLVKIEPKQQNKNNDNDDDDDDDNDDFEELNDNTDNNNNDNTDNDNNNNDNEQEDEFQDETKSSNVIFTQKTELFTAVPSRPFFPRGFLWDEGFHQLIISEFNGDLSLKIIQSWLNLMDENGWIGREQILGDEARSRVPPEFQTQHQDYANPPTLFLSIEKLLLKYQEEQKLRNYNLLKYLNQNQNQNQNEDNYLKNNDWLSEFYPKLKLYFNWFLKTQTANESFNFKYEDLLFKWKGRTKGHCLTSGLDDYPRPIVSDNEAHVDLLSWVGYMSKVLKDIAKELNYKKDEKYFENKINVIKKNLIKVHWNQEETMFCDATIDRDNTKIQHTCHKGYISLIPFITGLITKEDKEYDSIIELIKNELWSEYGILSLSSKDNNYLTKEQYWRGPIWLNINYLILKMLDENLEDQKIKKIYYGLRKNLIENMVQNYKKTGFIFESYEPINGNGKGTKPFTGWSSLILLIMAEKY
ncbi:glycoside hydrolase [Neoconidiobolus thromboides FSU 785]|nr:glycoside hydrolase [Neoconidiobolus thromboides FSU 785]